MRAAYLFTFFLFCNHASSEPGKPDFSEGLKRIAALGLPDMKDAEWVKLKDPNESHFTSTYPFTELNIKLTGNAWKLKSSPQTYMEFGCNQPISAEEDGDSAGDSSASSGTGILGKMLQNHKKKNPDPEKPKPEKPADSASLASKDAAKIIEKLSTPETIEEFNNSMRWGYSNTHGRLMLFAAQLFAAGEIESANSLAAALFLAAENDAALIDGAIDHFADLEYQSIASRFFENGDWVAYHKDLTALTEKFPRGWKNRPAVMMLMANIEKRSEVKAPSLPNITIKPEALALLKQLLERPNKEAVDYEKMARERGYNLSDYTPAQRKQIIRMIQSDGMGYSSHQSDLWTITPPKNPKSTIDQIKAMGMDGLIALAAVADDESLIPVPNNSDSDNFYGGNSSALEDLKRRYDSLYRPTSRGEIASALLSGVILIEGASDPFSGRSAPAADVSTLAIEFWQKHKNKSAIDLAALYLSAGNSSQQSVASSFLIKSKDPKSQALFEKTILSSDNPLNHLTTVESYLTVRKAAAKSFANQYIKLIKENPPNAQDLNRSQVGYYIQEAGGLDNYLKKLSLKVGDVSLDQMIATALKAKPKEPEESEEPMPRRGGNANQSPLMALASNLDTIPIHECLSSLGKVANKATPQQWMDIHALIYRRISVEAYSHFRQNPVEEGDEESSDSKPTAPPNFTPLPQEIIDLWKSQLSRTDPIQSDHPFTPFLASYGAKNFGDASTLLLDLATCPQATQAINTIASINESSLTIIEISRKRAAAWLEGKEPEPWPDGNAVSEERKKEISDKLNSLKKDEIIPFAKSLVPNERMAFMFILNNYEDVDSIPAGLKELSPTIVSHKPVFATEHDPDAIAKLNIPINERITPELITRISDDLLKDPETYSKTEITFGPAAMSLGTGVTVSTSKTSQADLRDIRMQQQIASSFESHGNPDAISIINVYGASDIRYMKDGKPFTATSEYSNGSATDALKKVLESNERPYVQIYLLSRKDAEAIISKPEE